jgi:hypothetical protein
LNSGDTTWQQRGSMRACATPTNNLGLILVMTGFLLQWPSLLTLLMFLVLVVM